MEKCEPKIKLTAIVKVVNSLARGVVDGVLSTTIKIKASTCEWMRRASLILTVLTFIFFWFTAFSGARSGLAWRDLSQAGVALWVFLILGAIIILLQLIPAIILFFSFVGTGSHLGYKVVGTKKKKNLQKSWNEGNNGSLPKSTGQN